MSLNDDALNELSEESKFLTTPKTDLPPPTDDMTVLADGKGQPTEPSDALIDRLTQTDLKIKTVVDDVETIHRFEDVSNTIQAAESISQSDVVEVEKTFGGFLGEEAQLEEFTKVPTRVGLTTVQRHMTQRIETLKSTVRTKIKDILIKDVNDSFELAVNIEKVKVPNLLQLLEQIQDNCKQIGQDIGRSRNFIAYTDPRCHTMLDYSRTGFSDYSNMEEATFPDELKVPKELYRSFSDLMQNPMMKEVIYLTSHCNSTPLLPIKGRVTRDIPSLNVLSLCELLGSTILHRVVEDLYAQYFEHLTECRETLSQIQGVDLTNEQIDALMKSGTDSVFEFIKTTLKVNEMFTVMTNFVIVGVKLIDAHLPILNQK